MRKLNEPVAQFCLKDCPYVNIVNCGNNIIECKYEHICQMWYNITVHITKQNSGGPTHEKTNIEMSIEEILYAKAIDRGPHSFCFEHCSCMDIVSGFNWYGDAIKCRHEHACKMWDEMMQIDPRENKND